MGLRPQFVVPHPVDGRRREDPLVAGRGPPRPRPRPLSLGGGLAPEPISGRPTLDLGTVGQFKHRLDDPPLAEIRDDAFDRLLVARAERVSLEPRRDLQDIGGGGRGQQGRERGLGGRLTPGHRAPPPPAAGSSIGIA